MAEAKRKIPPNRMNLTQYMRQDWSANAEEGTTVEDILKPEYWFHKASELRPYDRIEVRDEKGHWIAELLVLNVDRSWAKVHLLTLHDLGPKAEEPVEETPKFHLVWKGPQRKWTVQRLEDGQFIQEGFDDKHKAREWMIQHERAMAMMG